MANIPDEVRSADLGRSRRRGGHDGEAWGNTRLQQNKFSNDMKKAMKAGGDDWNVIQLEASNQFSAIVCSDGNTSGATAWPISRSAKYQGKIEVADG